MTAPPLRAAEDTAIHRASSERTRLEFHSAPAPGRERPAHAKHVRRRPRRIFSLWARLSALAALAALLLLAAVGLVWKAARPYQEGGDAARQLAETRGRIAAMDAQNTALRRRIDALNTPDGVATEARKLGYVRPGEIPLVVEGVDAAEPAAPSPAPRPSPARRFWQHLTGR